MPKLPDVAYMSYPFRIGAEGAISCGRMEHIRHEIEQVLFTAAGERVFRPEFGAGARNLLFEPNSSVLWDVTRKRLLASLADALQGEVDPKTINVTVEGEEEALIISVTYQLSRIGYQESQRYVIQAGGVGHG